MSFLPHQLPQLCHRRGSNSGNCTGEPHRPAAGQSEIIARTPRREPPQARRFDHLFTERSIVFAALEEGYYQLSGVRAGFSEARFGQRRNNGPGLPIFVPRDGLHFVELRLKRFGAITGRVLDENRVGMPGVQVLAYI